MKKIKSIYTFILLGILFILINSCNKVNTVTYTLGESYGGGVIFYLDASSQHGLIAATSDQGTYVWGDGTTTNATGTAEGTGKANTAAIVKAQGTGSYAAYICTHLTLNGYTDWFLPSKDELDLLMAQNIAGLVQGFTSGIYWTSSEVNASTAWSQNFYTGTQGGYTKSLKQNVRAIRAF